MRMLGGLSSIFCVKILMLIPIKRAYICYNIEKVKAISPRRKNYEISDCRSWN